MKKINGLIFLTLFAVPYIVQASPNICTDAFPKKKMTARKADKSEIEEAKDSRLEHRSRTSPDDIYIKERVGAVEEHEVRDDFAAAHVYMDGTKNPYLIVGFPEGNSGVSAWFKSSQGKVAMEATSKPVTVRGPKGLHGVQYDMKTDSKDLTVVDSLLTSMRFIRDRELKDKIPKIVIPDDIHNQTISIKGKTVILHRKSLNELSEYVLSFEMLGDTKIVEGSGGLQFSSPTQIQVRVTALNSEKMLTPLTASSLFKPGAFAKINPTKRAMFSFLAFAEKLMAGSPRYFSLFGRDSIITTYSMFEDLSPAAIESVLMMNFTAMNKETGETSHETHEGEFVSLELKKKGEPYIGVDAKIHDYKMIDANFAFAQLAVRYMRENPARASDFLERTDERGIKVRDLLEKNFDLIRSQTAPFVEKPNWQNLLRFKAGETTGDWRDSDEGNGRGKRTFNVNAIFVPGALKAMTEIYSDSQSPLYNQARAAETHHAFQVWNTEAQKLFRIRVQPNKLVDAARKMYVAKGKDPATLPPAPKAAIEFFALSIKDNGQKVPIMHSDDSLMMLFGEPSADYLATVSQRMSLPYPYGLRTPVGIVIANAVMDTTAAQKRFSEDKYHGAVIWTMQEDIMQLGIKRQISRTDLSPRLKSTLQNIEVDIERLKVARNFPGAAEILMVVEKNGNYSVVPFQGDAIGNSNQLWSHLLITKEAEMHALLSARH